MVYAPAFATLDTRGFIVSLFCPTHGRGRKKMARENGTVIACYDLHVGSQKQELQTG